MSERPSVLDLFLPGIAGGMILAAVALQLGDVMFHDAFQQILPRQTFVVLSIGIGAASTIGLVSVFLHSRGNEDKPKHHIPSNGSKNKNGVSSGGTHVL